MTVPENLQAQEFARLLEELKRSFFQVKNIELNTIKGISQFALMIIVVSLLLCILISRALIKPLRQATNIAIRIGDGERDIDVYQIPKGEIGKLLQVLIQTQDKVTASEIALQEMCSS